MLPDYRPWNGTIPESVQNSWIVAMEIPSYSEEGSRILLTLW